jgi:hypothetical protein
MTKHPQTLTDADVAIREAQAELERFRLIHEEVKRVERQVAWPHPRRRKDDHQ